MSGIFGQISNGKIRDVKKLKVLINHSIQRGQDSSAIINYTENCYETRKSNYLSSRLFNKVKKRRSSIILGQSTFAMDDFEDSYPIIKHDMILLNDGLILNRELVASEFGLINGNDYSDVIIELAKHLIENGCPIERLSNEILSKIEGSISAALILNKLGKVILFSNTGSLYIGTSDNDIFVSSEKYPLIKINSKDIRQIKHEGVIIDIPKTNIVIKKRFV